MSSENNSSSNNAASASAELDRQTRARLDEIEEQVKKTPLTSELKPLSDLLEFYHQQHGEEEDEMTSSHFLAGVQALMQKQDGNGDSGYLHIRLVRGDGNCYYRAFLYALAEKIMQTNAKDNDNDNKKRECLRVVEWIKKDSWQKVLAAGYDEITIEAFYETIVELMDKIVSSSSGSSSNNSGSSSTDAAAASVAFNLHDEMNQENATSDYCTWYLRVVTAMHLKSDPDRFWPFLLEANSDMQQFCQREVEPMGKECEMVQALSLAEAFGVQVKIEYLDGHALVNGKLAQHIVGPENATLHLTLLYRPGHYDILYPATSAGDSGP